MTDSALNDRPLRRDVRTLGVELGRVLRRHGDPRLYPLVEEVRALCKQRRAGQPNADQRLREKIASLGPQDIGEMIRALSSFFDLANLAEDRHRVRVLRERERARHPQPRKESISDAIRTLRQRDATGEDVQRLLEALDIELVFTAHPTEAKRRTIRNMLGRLRDDLAGLDRDAGGARLPRERQRMFERLKTDLDCLWETDTLRPRRPTVLEEVERSLFVIDSLWRVMPELHRAMRRALRDAYPDHDLRVPRFLRFGSWIGGDRDGNPYVTARVTRRTLLMLRRTAVEKHLKQAGRLVEVLSLSTQRRPLSDELDKALTSAIQRWPACAERLEKINPHEQYRQWLGVIRFRLRNTQITLPPVRGETEEEQPPGEAAPDEAGAHPQPPGTVLSAAEGNQAAGTPDAGYHSAAQLGEDVRLMAQSLREAGHKRLADGPLQDWLDQITVFGFHCASLDVREDARRLNEAVAELAERLGLAGDFADRDEAGRQALLVEAIDPQAARALDPAELSETPGKTLDLFILLHQAAKTWGREALGTAIVSMTHHPSDVLSVLWLSRLAAARCGDEAPAASLPLVPLFETIDDLERADGMLADLFGQPAYMDHLRAAGGVQVCMVGYSDSTKDGGYLAANWRLYQAEQRLAALAAKRGVQLTLFHGRGGALGRGGGPAARGILSLPPDSVGGRIRITEQGEVLAERYDDPDIAYRHLEQVTWATLLVSSRPSQPPAEEDTRLLDQAAQASFQAYRRLIDDPGFVDYFAAATPIDSIETLPIGSRPARRRDPSEKRKLEDLRAIPYTFAWTQCRSLLTAWFGLGTGLCAAAEGGWGRLGQMYQQWPFFRAIIDNAELALAKADIAIASEYAALMPDQQVGRRIREMIDEEFGRSREAVLQVTGHAELLEGVPWLQRSIRVRNPYVDALNFIQIDLMRRLRAADDAQTPHDERLKDLLRFSVQGLAAGLRTTG